ncbi:MAG: ABC transporter ATP-binding protein [Spirochaetales bacterium]|nr:ABC transporter ATP-binding protein [Spirochaetales bacterium]
MKGQLTVSDLKFEYPEYAEFEADQVLRGLSFCCRSGEITVIIGGAESGKSTLALILAALVPSHTGGQLSGRVVLDGLDILGSPAAEIIENCGIIFQDPEKQTVTTDCFSEAAFALESLGLAEEEIISRVEGSFETLGIGHLLESGTVETSGGEKKKLAIAGQLCVNPDLWIMDETFEELDSPSRVKLLDSLKDNRRSVLIFTSKYYDIFEKADAFYHLRDGRLSEREELPFSPGFTLGLREDGLIPDFVTTSRRPAASDSLPDLISVRDLAFSYSTGREGIAGDHWAFDLNIDEFSLTDGEIVSIVGRNGCGKSTFGKLLCGLLIQDRGEIRAAGFGVPAAEEPAAMTAQSGPPASTDFLNSFCAYMFQNPDYQIFLPTVYQELSWGLVEAGIPHSEIKERVELAIENFNLPGASTPPAMMSYSARKRLQVAVYYLLKRPVFILDEADTGLSYHDFKGLIEQLRSISRGIIIITHNLELAAEVSDRVLGMSGGRITEDLREFSTDSLKTWLSASAGSGRTGR